MLSSCEEEDPLDIPVPAGEVEVSIERLDELWFDASAVTFRTMHPRWVSGYGDLYVRYVEDVLNLGSVQDSNLFSEVRKFTTDPAISEVQDAVQTTFPSLETLEFELTRAWSYYAHYFPEKVVPKHISFIGGFNTPAVMTEQGVGIGLEMFLGSHSAYYDYLQIPMYLRGRMTPEAIAPTVLKGWVSTEFPLENPTPTLLEAIIHQGKVLYCMDALFPRHSDGAKIFYNEEEIQWAEQHERFVWAHFIDNELLFTTESTEISKFTSEGPFTVDLVKESPSRMGHYIGWQIVRAYMKRQDKVDLQALMQTDAETILNQSKYKP